MGRIMNRFQSLCILLCMLSSASVSVYGQNVNVIGTPPNVSCIVGSFNFTEVDSITSTSPDGSLTVGTVTLNITRSATPSDIVSSNIGTFNFTQMGFALSNVGPTTSTGGTFSFANVGGRSQNAISGSYTGSLIMDPNTSYKVVSGQVTWGSGVYAGMMGPILFNTTGVSEPAAVTGTTYKGSGTTTFLATLLSM